MRQCFVTIENLKRLIATGDNLIDYLVTIGQDELSSTCSVTVADPKGEIASELINHTLLTGGIQKLKGTGATNVTSTSATPAAGGKVGGGINTAGAPTDTPKSAHDWELAIVKYCLANGVTDKGQIAYALATAKGESELGQNMNEKSSGQWYDKGGTMDLGRGLIQVTGVASYTTVKEKTGVDVVSDPNLANRPDVALAALVIGLRDGWFARGDKLSQYVLGDKQDFYGARAGCVGGVNPAEYENYAKGYYPQIDGLIAETNGAPPAKTTPPVAGAVTAQPSPPMKGSKISITIEGVNFEYYHQSTSYDAAKGTTAIGGQSVRYVMDRRKRSRTVTDTTLKAFAEQLTKGHGIKLDWQAPTDISYTAITQQGISDFAVLIRECQKSGYFVSDNNGTLTVKALSQATESNVTLDKSAVVNAVFRDEALDGSKTDNSSALLQEEPKAKIDPPSGSLTPQLPDVDKVKDTSVTGKATAKPTGKVAPGHDTVQTQQRSRKKRVKGLPATITLPTSNSLLNLKPLDVVTTTGFSTVLNRKWIVDHVAHKGLDATTEVKIYSPIEVIDLTPAPTTATNAGVTASGSIAGTSPGSFVMPCDGTVPGAGEYHNNRGDHLHAGWDISNSEGTPIYAMDDGTVTDAENGCSVGDFGCAGGYGNFVDVKHANGLISRYCHMTSSAVRIGEIVKQGQEVGRMGNTGHSFGSHLHFEIRPNSGGGDGGIDPKTYLPSLAVGVTVKAGGK
jgi:murein DD-endopeptidase MepM/ murein hydrolase activator NlpD